MSFPVTLWRRRRNAPVNSVTKKPWANQRKKGSGFAEASPLARLEVQF
jgi:hypothetical protein